MTTHAILRLLVVLIYTVALPAQAEEVLTCKDGKGRIIFTDDPRRCGKATIDTRDIKLVNSHSQFGALESKEYFNYANRAHTPLTGYQINIIAESELLETQPDLTHKAARRLQLNVLRALDRFPTEHRKSFKNIRYYLFSGKTSSYGGKDSGLWYFRKGNRISKRFDDSIIINSADNFVRISDQLALAVTIHELAHGYYFYHQQRVYPQAKAAFDLAAKSHRYRNLKTAQGKVVDRAYALENHREYFAELSAMYFSRHYYFPFDRTGLQQYDDTGFQMIERAWMHVQTHTQ